MTTSSQTPEELDADLYWALLFWQCDLQDYAEELRAKQDRLDEAYYFRCYDFEHNHLNAIMRITWAELARQEKGYAAFLNALEVPVKPNPTYQKMRRQMEHDDAERRAEAAEMKRILREIGYAKMAERRTETRVDKSRSKNLIGVRLAS